MTLGDRLKAYNHMATRNGVVQPQSTERHYSIALTEHLAHPLSAAKLSLAPLLARDFALDVAAHNLLFFDLETTGLGSAEQVYPFLIGAAEWNGKNIVLTSWFAETPAGEAEILQQFIARAVNKTLVSFNGKAFDLPLILRRAQKYHLTCGLARADHIDLFHTIRRIFPEKPARLIDAEVRLLGFSRSNDLSGAAVAQAYFEYLRFGKTDLRAAILQHNQYDVLSLVCLMTKVAGAFDAARRGQNSWAYKIHRDKSALPEKRKALLESSDVRKLDGRDLHALAMLYRREKKIRRAIRFFLKAYRRGYAPALIDAVRCLQKMAGKRSAVQHLARYGIAREEEKIQVKLLPYVR